MLEFSDLLTQGGGAVWLFMPMALALGALHGLEPGHAKGLMAAFIIAVRGTKRQAVLLGLAATLSHSAVVWLVAVVGLRLGSTFRAEAVEPYFKLLSALLISGIALWLAWRLRRETLAHAHDHGHDHNDDHPHNHTPPHTHTHCHGSGLERYRGQTVTTGQIIAFGLTSGLIPCPAAITVLLLCLQLQHVTLGLVMVLCFSLGLGLVLVGVGVAAAWGLGAAGRRWSWVEPVARLAPYASVILMLVLAGVMAWHGWYQLEYPIPMTDSSH
jgi:ABC-type nickel/cobalt efflux system permease component RcnA